MATTLDKIKIFALCSLSLIFGISIGREVLVDYESSTLKPWEWKNPPMVLNCYGEDLHEAYIEIAVAFWMVKGEKILFIENNPPKSLCRKYHRLERGVIKIYKAEDSFFDSDRTQALTRRKASLTTGLLGANIYIRAGRYTVPYLLAHELGHAFGYTHVKAGDLGHIMNPITERMGPKYWVP